MIGIGGLLLAITAPQPPIVCGDPEPIVMEHLEGVLDAVARFGVPWLVEGYDHWDLRAIEESPNQATFETLGGATAYFPPTTKDGVRRGRAVRLDFESNPDGSKTRWVVRGEPFAWAQIWAGAESRSGPCDPEPYSSRFALEGDGRDEDLVAVITEIRAEAVVPDEDGQVGPCRFGFDGPCIELPSEILSIGFTSPEACQAKTTTLPFAGQVLEFHKMDGEWTLTKVSPWIS